MASHSLNSESLVSLRTSMPCSVDAATFFPHGASNDNAASLQESALRNRNRSGFQPRPRTDFHPPVGPCSDRGHGEPQLQRLGRKLIHALLQQPDQPVRPRAELLRERAWLFSRL